MRRIGVLFVWLCIIASSAVHADTFNLLDDSDVVGQVKSISSRYEDTLLDIARRFDLGYNQITLANPTADPWLPGAGTNIILPAQYILPAAPRQGIVLNLAEMRLYYYPATENEKNVKVISHPVSIGREGWETPTGSTQVVAKIADPSWQPPISVRAEHAKRGEVLPDVVPPGPDNPLGRYAIRLDWMQYLIHGTNKPYGIGMTVSHGCVRLYPEDIESLFEQVVVGTPVYIVNQPYKAGWHKGVLYLQAYPPLSQDGQPGKQLTEAVRAVVAATKAMQGVVIDWEKVMEVANQASGIPVSVLK
jgi:L,D-transpeptidase ErfK/SrfK